MQEASKERLIKTLKIIEEIAMESEHAQLHDRDVYLSKIYRLAHIARIPSCHDVHQDWEKELKADFNDYGKKSGHHQFG